MSVTISPNIKKEKAQIDVYGNEVKPFTHEIVKPVDKPYIPTKEELEIANRKTVTTQAEVQAPNPLADIIKGEVQKAVLDSIKNIDIGAMVKQAVQDAFKP